MPLLRKESDIIFIKEPLKLKELPTVINKILHDYLSQINLIASNLIEGIYLTGSVPLNDYHSNKSDIDFITILKEIPDKKLLKQIGSIHHRIERTHSHPKLNGFYLTIEGIINHQKAFPSFFQNKMHFNRPFELDKVLLWELKTSSLTIYGTPAAELPIKIELNNVIEQLHQNINTYWTSWIKKHSPFHINHILLTFFPRLTEWGILGVARQLYTLETGQITSKLDAGKYCLNKLPEELKVVMLTAIAARQINHTQLKPSLKRAKQTLNCMHYIIAEFNKAYKSRKA